MDFSLSDAADLVRTKKVSPVELTRACLARIERLDPKLNAFITVTAETALAQAREAEEEIGRGRCRGPLHGIPIALKDVIDTAGVRTTAASALFKDRVPPADAEVVRRLKAAGAVLLGKTNLHELAYGGSSLISCFGPVRNPWNLAHITGGSSGGSAAAVAAGLCYGALGTDTGGSIRQPAACCGIVGFKPTYGLVSTDGVIPLAWSLDHVGPMTRTVADAALMLSAVSGLPRAAAPAGLADAPASIRRSTSSLRVGVARDLFYSDLDPEIDQAMTAALAVLARLTGGVSDVAWPVVSDTIVLRAEAWACHAGRVASSPELFQPETLRRLRTGADITAADYIHARRRQDQLRRDPGGVFHQADLLVTPTTARPAPAVDSLDVGENGNLRPVELLMLRNTRPLNIYGLPTISIPGGFTSAGLPIGLQITGPHGGDEIVLALAHAFEQATEWHTRRPSSV